MNYPLDNLRRILFLDIETANVFKNFDELDGTATSLWKGKALRYSTRQPKSSNVSDPAALYESKGAIFSEFAQIVCISVGYIHDSEGSYSLKVKSFFGLEEKGILKEFHNLLNVHFYDRHNQFICGHNIKEFDVPFLCRRSLIHGLKLPNLLNIAGYKPWQIDHLLDTMEMWKFGDYKHYTSLELLCHCLQIRTPKDGMKGSEVSKAFWEGRIEEIASYCQKDVVATAQVYLKLQGLLSIEDDNIIIEEETIEYLSENGV